MSDPRKEYYDKRGAQLVKNLQRRHFGACYCSTRQDALEKALSMIGREDTIGWGGALSAQQIGLHNG